MGCEKGETNVLDPGESETFWIKISSDCRGIISYKDDHNNYHSDIIVGYLTNGMGQVDEYHISGKNNPRYWTDEFVSFLSSTEKLKNSINLTTQIT